MPFRHFPNSAASSPASRNAWSEWRRSRGWQQNQPIARISFRWLFAMIFGLSAPMGIALVALNTVAVSSKNGLYKPREHHGAGTVLLRGFNVKEAALVRSRTERIQLTERELADYSVVNDDILVSRVQQSSTCRKICARRGPSRARRSRGDAHSRARKPRRASPRFLVWLINSPQFLHDLRSRAKHAIGQSSINQKDLLGSKLPLPPIGRQEDLIERIQISCR